MGELYNINATDMKSSISQKLDESRQEADSEKFISTFMTLIYHSAKQIELQKIENALNDAYSFVYGKQEENQLNDAFTQLAMLKSSVNDDSSAFDSLTLKEKEKTLKKQNLVFLSESTLNEIVEKFSDRSFTSSMSLTSHMQAGSDESLVNRYLNLTERIRSSFISDNKSSIEEIQQAIDSCDNTPHLKLIKSNSKTYSI